MDKARIYVDFNEMIDFDTVLLSRDGSKLDSDGNRIEFYEGMPVSIYMDDVNDDNEPDNLIAEGIAIKNTFVEIKSWAHVKWCCRINKHGIYHESDTNK